MIHLLNDEVPDIIQQEDQEKKEAVFEKGQTPRGNLAEYQFEVHCISSLRKI